MKKNYYWLFLAIILLPLGSTFAQQRDFWSPIDEAKIANSTLPRKLNVKKSSSFQLSYQKIKSELMAAPAGQTELSHSNVVISFPDADGKIYQYRVRETTVLHPKLAKQFPNNKTYEGVALDDPLKRIKFNTNTLGMHAMIINADNSVQYIDPVSRNKSYYKLYKRGDLQIENYEFQCLTKAYNTVKKTSQFKTSQDKKLRTFRLALASTGEYSQFHINKAGAENESDQNKKAIVLAEMTTAINRVNALFENDLAITFQIIPNNTDIIYLDPDTDPYDNDDGVKMLTQNQLTCASVIGDENFDIGHVLSTDGGGVASLASTCTNSKARGVTGSRNPTGDYFYFDFIAHEFGHQLGASHTFTGNAGSCSDNENLETAVEPGSGSTIMAYAGICTPQNVQEHSDMYFHVVSINEMLLNITEGNSSSCGEITDLVQNRHVPIVDAGENYNIPLATPFKLTGTASDGDNDPITFAWEQIDAGTNSVPPRGSDTSGPLFRSVAPSLDNVRYFPELSTVVRGDVSSKWEVTPTTDRDLNFSLTVRDNNLEAGQTGTDEMTLTAISQAGPFKINSQNEDNLVWELGATQTINWDVAGTDANGIDVSHVNIYMSTDGGKHFDIPLKLNTENDGEVEVQAPNTPAFKCYIMVEAVDNVFFAINKKAFSVGEFEEFCEETVSNDTPLNIPDNDFSGLVSTLMLDQDDLIASLTVGLQITHTWVGDLTVWLESPSGTLVKLVENQCFGSGNEDIDVTFDDQGAELVCETGTPSITGVVLPLESLSVFEGESTQGAWKLRVVDDANQDVGVLESWHLNICTSVPKLSVDKEELEGLVVYPNPTEGELNISFQSVDEQVEVSLYDVLGRQIRYKKYNKVGFRFRETLNYYNLAKGIYILKIKNGSKLSAKRIQIQ